MLPFVLPEKQLQPFKFWHENHLRDGVHFKNELFCRLKTVDISQRVQLYQLACRFANQWSVVLVTVGDSHCSLWVSLRSAPQLMQDRPPQVG